MNESESQFEDEEPDAESDRTAQINVERCFSCRHAKKKDPDNGTLVCKKHNMLVDAPHDEIPDDCKEYEN